MKKKSLSRHSYSESFKREVVRYYLQSSLSRKMVALKFGIHDPSSISHWLRIFTDKNQVKRPYVSSVKPSAMKTDHELDLEDRIKLLEKALAKKEKECSDAHFKAFAYETMIELAEEEFAISIRKKSGTKQ